MKIGKLRISAVRNKSFEDKQNAIANVGESIQSVVMREIYEKCGVQEDSIIKINQCDIKAYQGEEVILPLRLPLSKENIDDYLPLTSSVHPFFISLHVHDDIFEDRPDLVEYFQKYQPIGCRDEISCEYFRTHGIESYIMGCYTLMFLPRENTEQQNKIVCVDISSKLDEVIPSDIKKDVIKKTHAIPYLEYPVSPKEDDRLEQIAAEYVDFYRNEAKLVITSRLHAAAPCIAMGIPVILASDNVDFRYAWIDRFLPIYQASDYNSIQWNPSVVDVSLVRNNLFEIFDGIINRKEMSVEPLQKLDAYYRSRNKTEYYKMFRQKLMGIYERYQDKEFSYAIWGAGNHALFVYELMKEMYPKSILIVVIDKYKTGIKFGVPIIKGNDLTKYNVEHVCISTKPGTPEAVAECERIWGKDSKLHYTIVTSQQES